MVCKKLETIGLMLDLMVELRKFEELLVSVLEEDPEDYVPGSEIFIGEEVKKKCQT